MFNRKGTIVMTKYKEIVVQYRTTMAILTYLISSDKKVSADDLKAIKQRINSIALYCVSLGQARSTRTSKAEIDYAVNFTNDKIDDLIAIAERGNK